MAEIEERLRSSLNAMNPETVFRTWLPASMQGVEQMQQIRIGLATHPVVDAVDLDDDRPDPRSSPSLVAASFASTRRPRGARRSTPLRSSSARRASSASAVDSPAGARHASDTATTSAARIGPTRRLRTNLRSDRTM